MPLRKGFRGKVPCPFWLLDCPDARIIPLAQTAKHQSNPIYSTPPDKVVQEGDPVQESKVVAHHCSEEELHGSNFRLAYHRGLWFLCAKVLACGSFGRHHWTPQGYINIWQGSSLERSGTLYCALAYSPNYSQSCLCGQCSSEWMAQGWVCPLLEWN